MDGLLFLPSGQDWRRPPPVALAPLRRTAGSGPDRGGIAAALRAVPWNDSIEGPPRLKGLPPSAASVTALASLASLVGTRGACFAAKC